MVFRNETAGYPSPAAMGLSCMAGSSIRIASTDAAYICHLRAWLYRSPEEQAKWAHRYARMGFTVLAHPTGPGSERRTICRHGMVGAQ